MIFLCRGIRSRDFRTDNGAKNDEGWPFEPVKRIGKGISGPEREEYKRRAAKRIRSCLEK